MHGRVTPRQRSMTRTSSGLSYERPTSTGYGRSGRGWARPARAAASRSAPSAVRGGWRPSGGSMISDDRRVRL